MQMIVRKAMAVSLPLSKLPPELAANDDLAGPLFFCLLLGAVLLLVCLLRLLFFLKFSRVSLVFCCL